MTIKPAQMNTWSQEVDYWRKKYADQGLQYDLLQQRIKELEADALRYRWLREGAFTGQWLLSEVTGTWADKMDATIDRAMTDHKLSLTKEPYVK